MGTKIEWGTPLRASKLEPQEPRGASSNEEGQQEDATARWQPLVDTLFDDKAVPASTPPHQVEHRGSRPRSPSGGGEEASPAAQVAAMRSRVEKLRAKSETKNAKHGNNNRAWHGNNKWEFA